MLGNSTTLPLAADGSTVAGLALGHPSSPGEPDAPRRAPIVRFGRCEVRIDCREVLVDGRLRALQPRPFDLLVYLIENRDRVVPIDELLDRVWGAVWVQQGSVPAAVLRVRKALCAGEPGAEEIIRTYQRVGYRFVARIEPDMR